MIDLSSTRTLFILSSVSDYIFTPCIFDSEEDLLLYVSEYFDLKNQVITMEELDDYDLQERYLGRV